MLGFRRIADGVYVHELRPDYMVVRVAQSEWLATYDGWIIERPVPEGFSKYSPTMREAIGLCCEDMRGALLGRS